MQTYLYTNLHMLNVLKIVVQLWNCNNSHLNHLNHFFQNKKENKEKKITHKTKLCYYCDNETAIAWIDLRLNLERILISKSLQSVFLFVIHHNNETYLRQNALVMLQCFILLLIFFLIDKNQHLIKPTISTFDNLLFVIIIIHRYHRS